VIYNCFAFTHSINHHHHEGKDLDVFEVNLRDPVNANDPHVSVVRVSIEDTGIGLSDEARDNLFQPFKQVQRLAGGTGLGLFSLSKRVEALGGSRGVHGRKDGLRGSNFWFTFPYRPDYTPEVCLDALQKILSVSMKSLGNSMRDPDEASKRLHVSLVDDSLIITQVLCRALRQNGCEVTTASNGSVAFDRLVQGHATEKFDFVLMDLQMPVMVNLSIILHFFLIISSIIDRIYNIY
jgi:hypothetical protein